MNNWQGWYNHLKKPSWTPDGKTISIIWTILYPVIFVTYLIIFYLGLHGTIPAIVTIPFILNLIFNFLFTPLQFGRKNLVLASVDIVLIWLTIVWGMYTIYPYSRLLAYVQVPYLVWVTIASTLQFSITFLNKNKKDE